jgi:ankyrin repeat protein
VAEIFISYSRKDRDFVEALRVRFNELGRDIWVDVEDIPPTAKWRSEVLSSIEQANAFVFVLSPDSIVSRECLRELAHAVKGNKRIIPVVHREVDPKAVPLDLTELNWISLPTLDAGFDTLLKAIDTDLEWVRAHTRLGVRALEWDTKDRDPSLLLRGHDLRASEQWLANGAGREPAPTSLQAEYVRASRRATITRRRLLISSLGGVLSVVASLGFLAYERGGFLATSVNTLTRRMDEAAPNRQPLNMATATIEMVVASVDPSHHKDLDFDITAHDLGCQGSITVAKGTAALLTLSSADCFYRKETNGQVIYTAVVNMNPSDSASGQPVSWLSGADSMRVGIDLIPEHSRITRGRAVLTFNGSIRMEIAIPPQILGDDDTALAPIPKTVLTDLSKGKDEKELSPQTANRNSTTAVEPLHASGGQFAIAIEKGKLGAIKALVESGADPDTLIEYGPYKITPLMKACHHGEQEIAQYLLDKGANVNAVDSDGNTALYTAVLARRVETVRMLISRGAKVNTRNLMDFTPIASAAAAGSTEIVGVLAEAKADLRAETSGLTPLMFAASGGETEMIQLLVKLGAPVNQPSTGGDTTALISAIYSGKTDAVQALIDLKADVNVRTKSGNTPVKAAQDGDQTDMLALLRAAGATEAAHLKLKPAVNTPAVKVDAAPRDPKKIAALWAAVETGDAATAKTLIAEGADVNLPNEYRIAPLASAAERGERDMVVALLRAGANVNARNTYGGTALQVAVLRGFTPIVRILIDAGADVARDRKELLELARQEKHPDIEKILLEAKK